MSRCHNENKTLLNSYIHCRLQAPNLNLGLARAVAHDRTRLLGVCHLPHALARVAHLAHVLELPANSSTAAAITA